MFIDDKNDDSSNMIKEQIKKQVQRNIHVQIISPIHGVKEKDQQNLVTRKVLSEKIYSLPAQILLYGKNKVAITTFDNYMITALIESKGVRDSFEQIFQILWNVALPPKY